MEASARAQRFPMEAKQRFTARGRQVTLVHAAVYFGAPFPLVRELAQIDPAARHFRAQFRDSDLHLTPVEWARILNRGDLIQLLQPPYGPFG
jgi:hypothetical protein